MTSNPLWRSVARLRRAPGFLALAAGTLALGVGASTALFSLVNGILLRELPYPQAARIVRVQEVGAQGSARWCWRRRQSRRRALRGPIRWKR